MLMRMHAHDAHNAANFIFPFLLGFLKAGSYLASYQFRAIGMHRDCHEIATGLPRICTGIATGTQRELHGMSTGSPRNAAKAATTFRPQLPTGHCPMLVPPNIPNMPFKITSHIHQIVVYFT